MAYTRDHGKIALRYLAVLSDKLPHFEKTQGASFFLENFSTYLQQGRECHRCACEPHLSYFSVMLAYRIQRGTSSEPDDLFLFMCYVYVLYISQHHEFDLGGRGYRKMQDFALQLEVHELDMLVFLKEIAADLCDLRTEKLTGIRPSLRLVS